MTAQPAPDDVLAGDNDVDGEAANGRGGDSPPDGWGDTDPAVPHDETASLSLSEKLETLYRTMPNPAGGRWTDASVADAIKRSGGPGVSANYLYMLRKGHRTNPTKDHLGALAAHFDVPAGYFFDDALSASSPDEVELLAAIRSAGVEDVARLAARLPPRQLRLLRAIMREVAADDEGQASG